MTTRASKPRRNSKLKIAANQLAGVLKDFDLKAAQTILRLAALELGWDPDVVVGPLPADHPERKRVVKQLKKTIVKLLQDEPGLRIDRICERVAQSAIYINEALRELRASEKIWTTGFKEDRRFFAGLAESRMPLEVGSIVRAITSHSGEPERVRILHVVSPEFSPWVVFRTLDRSRRNLTRSTRNMAKFLPA